MPHGGTREKTEDCGPFVGRSAHIPPTKEPAACKVLPRKAGYDLALGDPVTSCGFEADISLLWIARVAAVPGIVGRPAVVELVDHLGFVKRCIALGVAGRCSAD
jgi:hypothetical protein